MLGLQYIVVTQALVTNLPTRIGPLAMWRDYNQRAGCEGVDQATRPRFRAAASLLGRFLGHRAGAFVGGFQLQFVRLVPAAPRVDGAGDRDHVTLSALHHRGNHQSNAMEKPR